MAHTSPTASQTLGPFYNYALLMPSDNDLTRGGQFAPAVTVSGKLFDGEGQARRDFLLEWWQADASGKYAAKADASFRGFGRAITAPDGSYSFTTVKPGAVPFDAEQGGNRWQAPHAALAIFGPGLMRRLVTRVYFADEDNTACPVLGTVPSARQPLLMAKPTSDGTYVLDLTLSGKRETPFFAD